MILSSVLCARRRADSEVTCLTGTQQLLNQEQQLCTGQGMKLYRSKRATAALLTPQNIKNKRTPWFLGFSRDSAGLKPSFWMLKFAFFLWKFLTINAYNFTPLTYMSQLFHSIEHLLWKKEILFLTTR